MNWRLLIHMNGASMDFARTKFIADWIAKLQHRDHAYGKPYIKGMCAGLNGN